MCSTQGTESTNAEEPPEQPSAAPSASGRSQRSIRRRKRTRRAPRAPLAPAVLWLSVEAAAERLSLGPVALRARLRRAERAEGDLRVARIGAGVVGVRFGRQWRLRFDEVA